MATEEPKLFCQREDWADVTPLNQYVGVKPLCPIFYSENYKDATDYFRGIVESGEKSPRVLELTEAIIHQNPAHYSAWQYRYQTLLAIKAPLEKELDLMDGLAVTHLKTYQVWHHRRLLVMQLRNPLRELKFLADAFESDAKNYHTWSYRQWLLSYFDKLDGEFEGKDELWDSELEFVGKMLDQDLRNNSAWHHRFFVIFGRHQLVEKEVVQREIRYAKEMIALAPNNASVWNYLRGLLDHTNTPYEELRSFVELFTARAPDSSLGGEDVLDLDNPGPAKGAHLPAVPAVEFLADIHEKMGKKGLDDAIALWTSLATTLDVVRKKYWEYRIHETRSVAV